MKRIDAYWYSQNPVAWLLLPISWLYCGLVLLRRFLYSVSVISSYPLPVPVVIVGNINVGGTGKTPLLIALCERLRQIGYKPGVISRGYGGNVTTQKLVTPDDSAALVGDEPLLIATRTQCPVAVGTNRVKAAELLLAQHDCDLLLSDDGLQHYGMVRDYEIAVVDSRRLFGNGFCLPAGPLREPVNRLNKVDLTVYHGKSEAPYNFHLQLREAINLSNGEVKEIEAFMDKALHAVAGIGHPQRFFEQLVSYGLSFSRHAFPDHYQYKVSDLKFTDDAPILMTEKDAVKCRQFNLQNVWYLPANAVVSAALLERFEKDINSLVTASVNE